MDYNGGFTSFSWARFGQQFNDKVANPQTILLWYRQRDPNAAGEFLLYGVPCLYGCGPSEFHVVHIHVAIRGHLTVSFCILRDLHVSMYNPIAVSDGASVQYAMLQSRVFIV